MESSIAWDDVIKKEARGTDDADFGEVQEIGSNYIVTKKGVVSKDKFYVPKYLVEGYDGHTLWFNAEESQLDSFKRTSAPDYSEYAKYRTAELSTDIETRIPVIEERLNVSKRVSTSEATITKEPVTETETVEVPVTHEEVSIERRPASGAAASEPVRSKTEIKVPLNREEVEVSKEPYVKEEVSIKKEPVTETRTVSDTVTKEKVSFKE